MVTVGEEIFSKLISIKTCLIHNRKQKLFFKNLLLGKRNRNAYYLKCAKLATIYTISQDLLQYIKSLSAHS